MNPNESEWRGRFCLLDVDGVANSSRDKDPDFMNPANLRILNELHEELGFQIVLSSTWRLFFDMETFNSKLLKFGAKFQVMDYTPRPWQLPDEVYTTISETTHIYKGMSRRGDEIRLWLKANQLVPKTNCSICIIDDMDLSEFKGLTKYLVSTSMETGIHKGHMKWVREIFKKQEAK